MKIVNLRFTFQKLNLMNLILTLVAIYLFFRISVRWIFPWLLKRYIKKVQQRYYTHNNTMNEEHHQQDSKPKVTINYPGRKKHFDVDDIEYTKFEDINEDNNSK